MKTAATKSWKSLLEKNDAGLVWQSLHRLVSSHPLVRSAQRSQQKATHPSSHLSLHDLTQDLYVLLLEKARFAHYLMGQMSDAEIEREIFQIELTNMLIGRLRRRQPENYRIVRRISTLLETEDCFREWVKPHGRSARYRQAANAVYGLREWGEGKRLKDSATFEDLTAGVSVRMRNRRRVGCLGEAQMIITNQELIELLVEIFRAIDSPASLRVLRKLALSKLPVFDAVLTSIDQEIKDEELHPERNPLLVSNDANPEQRTVNREHESQARHAARDFLDRISRLTRAQSDRTERFWRVLWHCYFDPEEPSQLAVAAQLGLSDSSVSDYRRKMEGEMRRLDFSPDYIRFFVEELDLQLRRRLAEADAARLELQRQPLPVRPSAKAAKAAHWPAGYASLAAFDNLPAA
jgi:hypothetical protein